MYHVPVGPADQLIIALNCLQLTITDNDLIEKSNLNRQFLFRPHHIQVSHDHDDFPFSLCLMMYLQE